VRKRGVVPPFPAREPVAFGSGEAVPSAGEGLIGEGDTP